MSATGNRWDEIRGSVADVVPRLRDLLLSVRDPDARAVGEWSIAETVSHLSFVFAGDGAIARMGETARERLPIPSGLRAEAVREMNAGMLAADSERDVHALAERIDGLAKDALARLEEMTGEEPVPWLGGITVPVSAVTSHLLFEIVLHGFDVARGAGLPWRIEPRHAIFCLEDFLFRVLAELDPAAFVDRERAAGLRAAFEIRLRGGGRTTLAFDDGRLTVERAGARRADCVVSADPSAFLLVGMGRIGAAKPALTGKIVAWGRRPLLATKLPHLIKTP